MNGMYCLRQTRAVFAYSLAILSFPGIILLFFAMGQWSDLLAELPFMKIHPRYQGGEIVQRLRFDRVEYRLHRPVLDGLISERKSGFMQVDILLSETCETTVRHTFDWDWDGVDDFFIVIDKHCDSSATPICEPLNPAFDHIESWARTENGWILRLSYQPFMSNNY